MKLKASLQEISTLYGFPWGCFTPIDLWGKWGTSYYDPSISKTLLVKKKILYLHLKETEKTSSMFHIQMKTVESFANTSALRQPCDYDDCTVNVTGLMV